MADVVLFIPGKTPEYRKSVNTPDYENDPNAVINPDLSNVQGVEVKFWKLRNGSVVEMNTAEKQTVLVSEEASRLNQAARFRVPLEKVAEAIIIIGNQRWSKGQTVTKDEVINLLKTLI